MSEWIEWNGDDESPVPPGTKIDVRCRDGEEILGLKDLDGSNWLHVYYDADIVAYRIIKEGEE